MQLNSEPNFWICKQKLLDLDEYIFNHTFFIFYFLTSNDESFNCSVDGFALNSILFDCIKNTQK